MLRLGLGQLDTLHHHQLIVGQAGGKSHAQGERTHLFVNLKPIFAGLGAKDDGAAAHDGRTVGTLTRIAGTLLLEGLLAAAGHKSPRLDGMRAGPESRTIGAHHEVQNLRPHLDLEHFGRQGNRPGFLLVLIVNFHISHCLDPLCVLRATACAP